MKRTHGFLALALAVPLAIAGCTGTPNDKAGGTAAATKASGTATEPREEEAKIRTNLAKLDPADRKLAEEQRYCAIESENRLGLMGKPVKVLLKDQPVFLCCKGCVKKAEKDPEGTLARAQELKQRAANSPGK